MKTQNHYEQAFAAYLREQNVVFLPTLEIYRNFGMEKSPRSLKNLDFVLLGGHQGTAIPLGKKTPAVLAQLGHAR